MIKKVIIFLILLTILISGGFFTYSEFIKPKIISINIIEAEYIEDPFLQNRCSTCYLGYYFNDRGEKECPLLTIGEESYNDCKPHGDSLCISSEIKASFNLQIKNYKSVANCKIFSENEELYGDFGGFNGVNQIPAEYGNYVNKDYNLRVCCSLNEKYQNPACSEIYHLERRCYQAAFVTQ